MTWGCHHLTWAGTNGFSMVSLTTGQRKPWHEPYVGPTWTNTWQDSMLETVTEVQWYVIVPRGTGSQFYHMVKMTPRAVDMGNTVTPCLTLCSIRDGTIIFWIQATAQSSPLGPAGTSITNSLEVWEGQVSVDGDVWVSEKLFHVVFLLFPLVLCKARHKDLQNWDIH